MKTYYQVLTSFDDKGNVVADIVGTVQATKMPESRYTSTKYFDVYSDWFESEEEARDFIEEAKEA